MNLYKSFKPNMDQDEWKVCFSKSHKREYYFNKKSGKSVWTLEETANPSVSPSTPIMAPKKDKKQYKSEPKNPKSELESNKQAPKKSLSFKMEKSAKKRKANNLIDSEISNDDIEPMDVDEVIENVRHMWNIYY